MAYASYEDVILRYPYVADQAEERVDALLSDAAAVIDSELAAAGVSVNGSDEAQMNNLRAVSCSMVARASSTSGGMFGVSSLTQMAGPIQQTTSYSNPTGDMYLTSSERRRLGLGLGRAEQVFYGAEVLGGGDARCCRTSTH